MGWGHTGWLSSTSSFLIAAGTTSRALTLSQAPPSAFQAGLPTHASCYLVSMRTFVF